MASITIRNLDEAAKQALRERAAVNGRSMEEEARLLIASLTKAGMQAQTAAARPLPHPVATGGSLAGKSILLVITGGIAAYKSLELIRRLREHGASVRCVMTAAAQKFVTADAVGAVSGGRVFVDLWDRDAEHDVGHIRLARDNDLIVVAPATADFIAKMANGLGDDLASTIMLANGSGRGRAAPVLLAPAMNPHMWRHDATRRNVAKLADDGIETIGPETGEMAESGEAGPGRMAEPETITAAVLGLLDDRAKPLAGLSAIVTSGPTHEPIDPVRYIANRSSGRQGHAIAEALAAAGASVTLVSGPVTLDDPRGVDTVRVETARQMRDAVLSALPADIAVMVAAVADWRAETEAGQKMKKQDGKGPQSLPLTENPDILKTIGHHEQRPRLVIGFAAETQNVEANAHTKLKRKRADWIVANDVSAETGIMGGDQNAVCLVTRDGSEQWPRMSKTQVADQLAARIGEWFADNTAEA